MKQKKNPDALCINRIRCILANIACTLLCVLVFLGVCIQLLDEPNPEIQEVGWKSYHLFTILSNMLMAASAAMCIPYAVDGLRNHNYHLPRWYVDLMFTGTTGVAVTFLVAIAVLAPAAGFYRVMIFSNNLLLHTICPILSIQLFLFVNSDHKIKFRSTFIAVVPVTAYALVYLVMVFVIGEDAGGWRDHYQIQTIADYLPLPVILLLMCGISFGLANLLRLAHNGIHGRRKADLERYYQTADAFDCPDIRSAIKALADTDRLHDTDGEWIVPRRILNMMERKYKSGLSAGELCRLYVSAYYRKEAGNDVYER